jgi:hypothetical protein
VRLGDVFQARAIAMRSPAVITALAAVALGLGCSDGSFSGAPSRDAARAIAWTATLEQDEAAALLVTPATALGASRVYGLIVTRGIRDASGRALAPSEDFAASLGAMAHDADEAVALWTNDPEDPANPYPDGRLVRADASVRIPDRFALRGLPDTPDLAAARNRLRDSAAALAASRGFSTTAPVRIATSSPVDLATVTPETLLFFERSDDRLDLDGLVAEAERRGVPRAEIALAVSLPTQPIEADLVAIQKLLADRARDREDLVVLADPDPTDDLPIGVFSREDETHAEFFADAGEVSTVVAGLLPAPDFRDASGVWAPAPSPLPKPRSTSS